MKFTIGDAAYPYLYVQCGVIAGLAADRELWEAAYNEYVERVYAGMEPALPKHCRRVLDVAGGLSGIGARLVKHYGPTTELHVLDGRADPPFVERHGKTFNNEAVAREFLAAHGVKHYRGIAPGEPLQGPYDLVVSVQGWCFHVPPSEYLYEIVKAAPGARLIVDVRRQKLQSGGQNWMLDLCRAFGDGVPLDAGAKWEQIAWTVPK